MAHTNNPEQFKEVYAENPEMLKEASKQTYISDPKKNSNWLTLIIQIRNKEMLIKHKQRCKQNF